MKELIIDGTTYANVSEFYADMAQQLSFPSYFGYNLDAFEECLGSAASEEAIRIQWKNLDAAREAFGAGDDDKDIVEKLLAIMRETKGVELV